MPVQMSNEQATRNGIQALEMAKAGVQRAQADVLATGNALRYGGDDGAGFRNLLTQWDEQCTRIVNALTEMIDHLHTTMGAQRKIQNANQEAISQAQTAGSQVYDVMHA